MAPSYPSSAAAQGAKGLARPWLWATTVTLSSVWSQVGSVHMNIRSSFGKRAHVATQLHIFSLKRHLSYKGWSWKTLILFDHAWKTAHSRSYWIHMWKERNWAHFLVSWLGYYRRGPPGRAHNRQAWRLYGNLPAHVHDAESGAQVEQPPHRRLGVLITKPAIAHMLLWEQPSENPGFVPHALRYQGKHLGKGNHIFLKSSYALIAKSWTFSLISSSFFPHLFEAEIKWTGLTIIGSVLWQAQYLFSSSGSWI